jgi:NTP pyrophosphatase (non-canonical NTP hydrolase)
MTGDFLKRLRRVNSARLAAWEGDAKADQLFHATELGGEVGELLNVAKKLHREAMGWRGSRATQADLAEEIGDVLICLDKLAAQFGIDIAEATTAKFNATSDKVGLPFKLGVRCEHCGADDTTSTQLCAPPFKVQEHAFSGNHPADQRAVRQDAPTKGFPHG